MKSVVYDTNYVAVWHKKMGDAHEFLSVDGEFLRFLCYFRLYIKYSENARITMVYV